MSEALSPEQEYQAFRESEKRWLDALVKGGVFNEVHQDLLGYAYDEMHKDPTKFKKGLSDFMSWAFWEGVSGEKIGDNVRVRDVNIYVARILVPADNPGMRGVGLNVVFGPGDPNFPEVQRLYKEACDKLDVDEFPLPFGIFWSDAYYMMGNEFNQGVSDKDPDSGWGVYNNWDVTWNTIQSGFPAFFRLGAPVFPPGFDSSDVQDPPVYITQTMDLPAEAQESEVVQTETDEQAVPHKKRKHPRKKAKIEPVVDVDVSDEQPTGRVVLDDFDPRSTPESPSWPPQVTLLGGVRNGRKTRRLPPGSSDGPTWEDYFNRGR